MNNFEDMVGEMEFIPFTYNKCVARAGDYENTVMITCIKKFKKENRLTEEILEAILSGGGHALVKSVDVCECVGVDLLTVSRKIEEMNFGDIKCSEDLFGPIRKVLDSLCSSEIVKCLNKQSSEQVLETINLYYKFTCALSHYVNMDESDLPSVIGLADFFGYRFDGLINLLESLNLQGNGNSARNTLINRLNSASELIVF